jgi:hypothetical protein
MKREEQILKRLTEQEGGLFYDTALRAMREFAKKDLLPPAEGAEQEKILTDFAEKMNTAMVNNDPEFEQIVNDHYFDLIEQPTAEGADEILVKHGFFIMAHKDSNEEVRKAFIEPVLAAMQDFAALHAQKIADKKYADTEADGYVFCGKCGKMKEI